MVKLPIKTISDLSLLAEDFLVVCRYIGLTEEEATHPKAGEWIVEELRNISQSSILIMQVNLKKRINGDLDKESPLEKLTGILTGKVDNYSNK